MTRSMWSQPPSSVSLRAGEVHVWRVSLEQPPERRAEFLQILNDEERARARRFHFDKHRNHFVVARGVLRMLLGRYLDAKPEALQFHYGAYGKPALKEREGGMCFNVSHSHETALFGFVQDRQIGVDIEYIKRDFSTEDIARRFFTDSEVESIESNLPAERVAAFYRCWTRKEAYIKAIGSGLSQPLNEFDVNCLPEWSLIDLEPREDYVGALAIEGVIDKLQTWNA
jgi:4'-phosphopantetheinyl transferase